MGNRIIHRRCISNRRSSLNNITASKRWKKSDKDNSRKSDRWTPCKFPDGLVPKPIKNIVIFINTILVCTHHVCMSILTLYINFVVFYSESAAVCMRLLATNNIHFSLLIPSKKEEERRIVRNNIWIYNEYSQSILIF